MFLQNFQEVHSSKSENAAFSKEQYDLFSHNRKLLDDLQSIRIEYDALETSKKHAEQVGGEHRCFKINLLTIPNEQYLFNILNFYIFVLINKTLVLKNYCENLKILICKMVI